MKVEHIIIGVLLFLWVMTSTISTCNKPTKASIDALQSDNKKLKEEIQLYEEVLEGLRRREYEASQRAEEQLHLYEIQKHKYDSLANLFKRRPLPTRPSYGNLSNDSLMGLWSKHTR